MSRPKIGFKRIRYEGNTLESIALYSAIWNGRPKRKPLKGDYYISGCPGWEIAYKAANNLNTEYFIATLVPKPKQLRTPF